MTITLTKLYGLLSEQVGKETAETLTTYIEEKIKGEVEDSSKTLGTKEDIYLLKEDMHLLKEDISDFKVEMIEKINELHVLIARTSKKTLRWLIVLIIPLYLTIIGLFIRFF